MPFDATISGTSSNSYVSVAQADSYFEFHLDGADWWNNLPTAKKQSALVQATVRLDQEMFGGRQTVQTQRLQWPRLWIIARDKDKAVESVVEFVDGNYYRPSNEMPLELQEATYEMALWYLKKQSGEFLVADDELQTIEQYRVGPLDITMKGNTKGDYMPDKVKALLKAIGPNAWNGERPLTFVR